MDNILLSIILGLVQGISEWLPISSSAMTAFTLNLFSSLEFSELVHFILFLHLGTFFAALIYFRKEVYILFRSLFNYKSSSIKTKKTLNFLIISTAISGVFGIILLKGIIHFFKESSLELTGWALTLIIGILLLFTASFQFSTRLKKQGQQKDYSKLKFSDGILLGFAQGLSVLPGISRSGITVSTLLLRKFDDNVSLKLSFLMSLPIVLFGNIFLNYQDIARISISPSVTILALASSFIFGIFTIHVLIKLSRKINFAWFALIFGLLMILGSLVMIN